MMSGPDKAIRDAEEWLRSVCHTPDGPYLRPFASNPRWRTAKVFLVGCNPATSIARAQVTFDDYWDGLTVHPEAFEKLYDQERKEGLC
jgi:hypothetical protein